MINLRLIDDYVINVITDEIVFYRNDVDPEVVENCLNIFNRLQSTEEVDEYLLNEEKVNSDEREFIIEALASLIKTETETEMNPETVHQVPGTGTGTVTAAIMPEPAATKQTEAPAPTVTPDPTAGTAAPEKQKRQWTRRITDGGSKPTQSTSEFIKVMEEKIEMVKILDQVSMPELPGGMTKTNRDIMVEFQKEQAALIAKFMERIQKA
jgi:hypothetical protein